MKDQGAIVEDMIKDPDLKNLYFDISWDEVAKYVTATPASAALAATLINRYPDRFIFGTDVVAPSDQASYMRVYELYDPIFKLLDKETKEKLLKGNYERIFDAARIRVRAWEKANT